jgi:hypothetical protein
MVSSHTLHISIRGRIQPAHCQPQWRGKNNQRNVQYMQQASKYGCMPPLNHPAWRHDDLDRGSSEFCFLWNKSISPWKTQRYPYRMRPAPMLTCGLGPYGKGIPDRPMLGTWAFDLMSNRTKATPPPSSFGPLIRQGRCSVMSRGETPLVFYDRSYTQGLREDIRSAGCILGMHRTRTAGGKIGHIRIRCLA